MATNNQVANLPRGIRNNNPGNLRSGIAWAFKTGDDAGGFAVFDTMPHGLRALAKDLTTKINSDGLTTIPAIISVYAPPSENDTGAYIQSVIDDSGISGNTQLQADPGTLGLLVRAIVNHENGEGPSYDNVSDADIAAGISMLSLSPAQTLDAAVSYAQANPVIVLGALAGIAIVVTLLVNHSGRRRS